MQYEVRYQVIEPKRHTYQNIIDRFGDQPASRYLEATLDVEPRENFHYRPTWARGRELYDPRYSRLRLTDPYEFADPRQLYYTPYVTRRAAFHEEFGKTLSYLEQRGLLARLPAGWRQLLETVVVPLRHYESGAQLVSVTGARFAYGTSVEQCCTFAAFDRIGNAQLLSRVGIAVGGGAADALAIAKQAWTEEPYLQPLRRYTERAMVTADWAEALVAVDIADSLLYPLLYRQLDERALQTGAGAYSLVAAPLSNWFDDQRTWLDALFTAWRTDPELADVNHRELNGIDARWRPQAEEAVAAIAGAVAELIPGGTA